MHTSEENFYAAVVVAAAILGLIITYFIITMIRHQRNNLSVYKTKIRAEISTLENERRRISTDLHDELGPLLSAVRMKINHLEPTDPEDRNIVAFANKHIDDILAKTREISYNLLPNTLVRKGLVKAVEEYISKLEDIHNIHFTLRIDNPISLSKEKEINIYRIIQEVIHNTIKHANASQLIIEMTRKNGSMTLMTADNGKGFNFDEKINANRGLGLYNLQSRTEILNGKFNYKSTPGVGTQYIFEIPLNDIS